jgi:hypothetical protein
LLDDVAERSRDDDDERDRELLASRRLLLLEEVGRDDVREAVGLDRDVLDDDDATALRRALSLELLLGRLRETVVFDVLLATERERLRSDDETEGDRRLVDSREREDDALEGERLAVTFERLRLALLLPL